MKRTGDALVIGLVALAHGLSHFFQLIIAPLFPLIKEELGVSYAALGFVAMLFYLVVSLATSCGPAANTRGMPAVIPPSTP